MYHTKRALLLKHKELEVYAFYVTRLFLVKFWYWHYTLFLDFSNTKSGITEDDCKNEAAVAEDGPRQVA